MTAKHFIMATAGHVDHGKSSLVKALTGTDPDRLPEEKARGITIDLGFAHLELSGSLVGNSSTVFKLGIVDVPGHEDFVKNMVAGVGSIDLALLVVAVDDGWMPQTEEHLQILTYLGVTRAVIVFTKTDLMEDDETMMVARVHERLADTSFADAPFVKTSVVRKSGLEDLKIALARVLANIPPQSDIGKPRLPVDRVFTLRGIGTVVTGTLTGGTFHRGQPVVIQPSGLTTRIRGIQSHKHDVEAIGPGTRTALNLPDLAISSKRHSVSSDKGVRRGDVITLVEFGRPSNTLGVALERSPRLLGGREDVARPLKDGVLVRIHHGSGNFPAHIRLFECKEIAAGQRVIAKLRLDSPVFVFAGDRFIVRDWSERCTLAGGVVLDPDVDVKDLRSETYQEFLRQRAKMPDQILPFVNSQLSYDGVIQRSALLVKARFSMTEIADAISRLETQNQAMIVGELVVDKTWWQTLKRRVIDAIETEHREHPEHIGLSLSKLRSIFENEPRAAGLSDVVITELCREQFVQEGGSIRQRIHQPALPPNLQAAGAGLRSALSAKPFEPPSRKELAPDSIAEQALRFLLETGEAVKLDEDAVLLAESLMKITEIVRKFLTDRGTATVSELRQAVGTSRRIMVPLLERLDREGITLRQGDKRVLRSTVSPKKSLSG